MRTQNRLFRKNILLRRGLKRFRRKIRSKAKKKERNRQQIGVSYYSRRVLIERNKAKYEFRHYDWIKVPSVFSLTMNTEETLAFVALIEEHYLKRNKVFIDLKDLRVVANGAIVVLLSILVKFRAEGIQFNGSFPKDRAVRRNLTGSGFFEHLYGTEKIKEQDVYSFGNSICTHANKKVDSKLSDSIIKKASKYIWGEERRCTEVQRVFLELMQNTNNHASLNKPGEHHWWTSISHNNVDASCKKVCFSFIDYGIGIFESLSNKQEGNKFFNIIPKLKKVLSAETNADILKLLLKGDVHKTATGEYFRGKGLPGIYEACNTNKISNLIIISNDAMMSYSENKYVRLKNKLAGTFVYWELNENNDNIKD
jgi:hypothetical protein